MKRIKLLNIAIVILFIFITVSYFVGLPYIFKESYKIGITILISTLTISFGLIYFLNNEENSYLKKELQKEFSYIFHDSTVAWILGLIIGSVISAFVLIFFGKLSYAHAEVNPSAFDIAGVYIGSVLGVLAIRAFYKSLHPIYDELELIKIITKDLSTAKPNEIIWFSFPAFNLCHFRVLTNQRQNGRSEFDEFIEELNAKITGIHYEFNGICYSKQNIQKLYTKYGSINTNNQNTALIQNAVTECINVASGFVDTMTTNSSSNHRTTFYELKPENPIESFIIIGDIVYTIQAWGLPIFKNNDFQDPFNNITGSKLVKLIAYRQYDKELSRTIIERTKAIVI